MITGNEPAMPAMDTNYREGERILELRYEGLTIRQHFALELTKAIITNCYYGTNANDETHVLKGIELADLLISGLNKTES